MKKWWENQSVKHAKDCSFTGGGRHDFLDGEPAFDLGNNRIYQVISDWGETETAIVTDCNTREQIQVYGFLVEPTGSMCDSEQKIKRYLVPDGPIDLRFGEDIPALSKQIEQLGYDFNSSIIFLNWGKQKQRDYPDFYCGCKLYYPDLAGAKS